MCKEFGKSNAMDMGSERTQESKDYQLSINLLDAWYREQIVRDIYLGMISPPTPHKAPESKRNNPNEPEVVKPWSTEDKFFL